jgi:plasmid maintenance system antidote protein VapI
MESGKTLIDRAAAKAGSRYRLAKDIDFPQSHLSTMASGKRTVPPALAAHLAAYAGEDPRTAALVAVIEQARDQTEREELASLFGIPLDLVEHLETSSSKV